MLFTIKNKHKSSVEQLRTSSLLNAYFVVKNYPMRATELILDSYINQQYKTSLKDMCVKLLLNLTFYKDEETGNLVLLFKNNKYDNIASLITYGNGAIPGSRILQTALRN